MILCANFDKIARIEVALLGSVVLADLYLNGSVYLSSEDAIFGKASETRRSSESLLPEEFGRWDDLLRRRVRWKVIVQQETLENSDRYSILPSSFSLSVLLLKCRRSVLLSRPTAVINRRNDMQWYARYHFYTRFFVLWCPKLRFITGSGDFMHSRLWKQLMRKPIVIMVVIRLPTKISCDFEKASTMMTK